MTRSEAKVLAKHGQLINLPKPVYERIDPATAAAYLETSKGNRRISQEHVARLADDYAAGRHQITHQGIAFDCDGHLIDGHHTLWAILLSGVTITVLVTRNLRREALRVIDTGKIRTLQDRLTLAGSWGQVQRGEAAVLRRMIRHTAPRLKLTPAQEYESWKQNAKHVRFAIALTEGLGKMRAISTVRAVLARAHKGMPSTELERFAFEVRSDRSLLTRVARLRDMEGYVAVSDALYAYLNSGARRPAEFFY